MLDALSSFGYPLAGMWVVFAASIALTISLGLILTYHWIRHAHNTMMTLVAIVAYGGISFILLSTIFGALVTLS